MILVYPADPYAAPSSKGIMGGATGPAWIFAASPSELQQERLWNCRSRKSGLEALVAYGGISAASMSVPYGATQTYDRDDVGSMAI